MIQSLHPSPETILVAGVGHGYELPIFAEHFPAARLIGYEPHPDLYKRLRSQRRPDLLLVKRALGDGSSRTLYLRGQRSSFYREPRRQELTATVVVESLDDCCQWHEIERGLLWLDAEGAELEILSGSKLLEQCFLWINVEVDIKPTGRREGAAMGWDVIRHLVERGWEWRLIHSAFDLGQSFDAVFSRTTRREERSARRNARRLRRLRRRHH